MIGFHGQRPIDGWLQPVSLLPKNTPFLSTNDLHMLRDAKGVNPGLRTVFRKEWNGKQHFTPDYQAAKQNARDFFNSFIDGTWQQQELWAHIDTMKEWNEYVATTNNEAERQLIITWLQAVTTVWNTEYRGKPICGGRDIPLACLSIAIGNDIDARYAEIIQASGNIASYHNYTHFINGVRDPLDWANHSGRWTVMDAQLRAQGIQLKWISTEGGPYAGVLDGWKSSKVLSGNLQRYIDECVKYQIDHISAWNAANNGRYLGGVLFTFGNLGWDMYELNSSEMTQIAQVVRDYSPVIPGDDMSWKNEIWSESVQEQIDRGIPLNPNAGLQQLILARPGYTPVHRERTVTTSDGVSRGFMSAEDTTGQGPRLVFSFVKPWAGPDKVEVFAEPGGTAVATKFAAPVGTAEERAAGELWD